MNALFALANAVGAIAYSPPPMRAVRGLSFTYEQLEAFAAALHPRRVCYRMLGPDDVIRADDEFLDDNCIDWNKPVGWEVGMRWSHNLKNARRRIPENRQHCQMPPPPWWCSRELGHDGPCAARMPGSEPYAGHCERPQGCVCGGDTPRVRAACSNWVKDRSS